MSKRHTAHGEKNNPSFLWEKSEPLLRKWGMCSNFNRITHQSDASMLNVRILVRVEKVLNKIANTK